ncbi:MAG TPA: FKBP-type peptidyl-prolyl cis-trans isomerase [Verrucomicrobia bacterium]|nr:FKBP-type peptidyl-prolyl cis-trans isomerase [Verrucomicrobiota bacterium]
MLLLLAAGVVAFGCSSVEASEAPAATNRIEDLSYSVGMSFGRSIRNAGFEVDVDIVVEGMKDVLGGRETRLNEQQMREAINTALQEVRARQEKERRELAEKNRKAAEEFLAENRKKPDVKTREVTLGDDSVVELQYRVITEGTGESPAGGDTVVLNVTGTTVDGKEFDSGSNQRRPLSRLPQGLREALQMMKVGGKWQIFLPDSLAFGVTGMGPVEPGAAVVYEVELLSVEKPQPLTSDIIKVPSAEELAKGAKIEVIKAEDVAKMQQTNAAAATNR